MARYSALLGKRVEVQYRAGDVFLPATATLVADSGKSIFLEERLVQKGVVKGFRWEIPYVSIIKIAGCPAELQSAPPREQPAPSPAAEKKFLSLKGFRDLLHGPEES